jgi:hypothetical protein
LPRGFILAFHSHNIDGNTYESNDHVALDASLALLATMGIPVLRLADIVGRLRARTFARLPERFAAITLDDGSDYDWKAITHPLHGPQEPMGAIVRRHSRSLLGIFSRRRACATSFVIASPEARDQITGPGKPIASPTTGGPRRRLPATSTSAATAGTTCIRRWRRCAARRSWSRRSGTCARPAEAERQVRQAARFIRDARAARRRAALRLSRMGR